MTSSIITLAQDSLNIKKNYIAQEKYNPLSTPNTYQKDFAINYDGSGIY